VRDRCSFLLIADFRRGLARRLRSFRAGTDSGSFDATLFGLESNSFQIYIFCLAWVDSQEVGHVLLKFSLVANWDSLLNVCWLVGHFSSFSLSEVARSHRAGFFLFSIRVVRRTFFVAREFISRVKGVVASLSLNVPPQSALLSTSDI